MLIIYQGEIDSTTDRRSPMSNAHINVMVKVIKINCFFFFLFQFKSRLLNYRLLFLIINY